VIEKARTQVTSQQCCHGGASLHKRLQYREKGVLLRLFSEN
jgi:hypothetical protein